MRYSHRLCEIFLVACSSLSAWTTAQPCRNVKTQKVNFPEESRLDTCIICKGGDEMENYSNENKIEAYISVEDY